MFIRHNVVENNKKCKTEKHIANTNSKKMMSVGPVLTYCAKEPCVSLYENCRYWDAD